MTNESTFQTQGPHFMHVIISLLPLHSICLSVMKLKRTVCVKTNTRLFPCNTNQFIKNTFIFFYFSVYLSIAIIVSLPYLKQLRKGIKLYIQ